MWENVHVVTHREGLTHVERFVFVIIYTFGFIVKIHYVTIITYTRYKILKIYYVMLVHFNLVTYAFKTKMKTPSSRTESLLMQSRALKKNKKIKLGHFRNDRIKHKNTTKRCPC